MTWDNKPSVKTKAEMSNINPRGASQVQYEQQKNSVLDKDTKTQSEDSLTPQFIQHNLQMIYTQNNSQMNGSNACSHYFIQEFTRHLTKNGLVATISQLFRRRRKAKTTKMNATTKTQQKYTMTFDSQYTSAMLNQLHNNNYITTITRSMKDLHSTTTNDKLISSSICTLWNAVHNEDGIMKTP
jgi:hypothetical protein